MIRIPRKGSPERKRLIKEHKACIDSMKGVAGCTILRCKAPGDTTEVSGGIHEDFGQFVDRATDPKILLLDEPTEGIQPNIVREIEATIKRLNQDVGLTLVLTEQHIRVAKELAHGFIIMDRGRVEVRGTIDELTDELVHKHLTI